MFSSIYNLIFGCHHNNYSFPRTAKPGRRAPVAAALTGTYVVCLDCGKEFAYDWQEMKIVSAAPDRRMVESALATKNAA